MKILFEIKLGNYGKSLNIKTFWTIKNKKVYDKIITLNRIPITLRKNILAEYKATGCLTCKNLRTFNFYLSRRDLNVTLLNNKIEII